MRMHARSSPHVRESSGIKATVSCILVSDQPPASVFAHRINKVIIADVSHYLRSKFFFLLTLHYFTMCCCKIDKRYKIDKEIECCSEFYSINIVIRPRRLCYYGGSVFFIGLPCNSSQTHQFYEIIKQDMTSSNNEIQ